MRRIIVSLATLALATAALAAPDPERVKTVLESQRTGRGFVRADDRNLYLGRAGNVCRVAPLDGTAPFDLQVKALPVDAQAFGDALFVLTRGGLEEWSLSSRQRIAEHAAYNGTTDEQQMQPTAFARAGSKLVITNGRRGMTFFDTQTKKITSQHRLVPSQLPLESAATGVTVQGSRAYVVVDNFSLVNPGQKPPFRGIVVLDVDREVVVSELNGMDPGVDSVTSDEKSLIVSFGGIPIWTYAIRKLQGNKLPEPELRVFRFPVKGHPTGAAQLDAKYYYTVFSKQPDQPGGVFERITLALDRRIFFLNAQ